MLAPKCQPDKDIRRHIMLLKSYPDPDWHEILWRGALCETAVAGFGGELPGSKVERIRLLQALPIKILCRSINPCDVYPAGNER
jgi:hypothetical protein